MTIRELATAVWEITENTHTDKHCPSFSFANVFVCNSQTQSGPKRHARKINFAWSLNHCRSERALIDCLVDCFTEPRRRIKCLCGPSEQCGPGPKGLRSIVLTPVFVCLTFGFFFCICVLCPCFAVCVEAFNMSCCARVVANLWLLTETSMCVKRSRDV